MKTNGRKIVVDKFRKIVTLKSVAFQATASVRRLLGANHHKPPIGGVHEDAELSLRSAIKAATQPGELKLAKPNIPVYGADGKRVMVKAATLRLLKEAGRIARLVKRKRDNAVTRAYLCAEPGEIAKRITAEPTIVRVLPTTWTHTASLAVGL